MQVNRMIPLIGNPKETCLKELSIKLVVSRFVLKENV